jgi:hypothetical protein
MKGIRIMVPEGGEVSDRSESRLMKDAISAAGRSLR